MSNVINLGVARAVRESHRSMAAALAAVVPLPATPACERGDCKSCPGAHDGIICGHNCGHGFKAAS